MTEKKAERRQGTVARQQKAAETDRVAKEFIEAERAARQKKTEKLEQLRLAREEADAAEAGKPSGKGKPARKRSVS